VTGRCFLEHHHTNGYDSPTNHAARSMIQPNCHPIPAPSTRATALKHVHNAKRVPAYQQVAHGQGAVTHRRRNEAHEGAQAGPRPIHPSGRLRPVHTDRTYIPPPSHPHAPPPSFPFGDHPPTPPPFPNKHTCNNLHAGPNKRQPPPKDPKLQPQQSL